MFSIFEQIKVYLIAAGVAVIGVLIAVFRARGAKIDNLNTVVAAKEKEIVVTAKVVAAEKEAATFVADNRVAKVEAEVASEAVDTKYDPSTKFYI